MLRLRIRAFPPTTAIWFADRAAIPSRLKGLFSYRLSYSQVREEPAGYIKNKATVSPFTTLLIDLASEEDALWGALRKTVRSEIRSAEAKIPHELTWSQTDPERRFYDFLADFCAKRDLWIPSRGLYKTYLDHLSISACHLGDRLYVLHFHLIDRERGRARLLWSARSLEDDVKRVTPKLNKLLHWRDLLYFRNDLRVRTYDWGGISLENQALQGVDDFKRGFGGTLVTEWNVDWHSPLFSPSLHRLRQKLLRRAKLH